MRLPCTGAVALLLLATLPDPALAWGYEGHEIIAAIARNYLTPAVREKVDTLLTADPDSLTARDMIARATWADAYRGAGHRETANWHFVDIELDHPDLNAACFGRPRLAGEPASQGPAQDCVVDKVDEFASELANPATSTAERILALKYVLHFVGDEHQPLHASDNHDHGGNCVQAGLSGSRTTNLHTYWDTAVVQALGSDPQDVADRLRATITPAQRVAWERGDAAAWAMETYRVATTTTYSLPFPAGCGSDAGPTALAPAYEAAARNAATLQLQRAGVRLALVLNRALARIDVSGAAPVAVGTPLPAQPITRPAASLECSAEADAKGLHGRERKLFRDRCKRDASALKADQAFLRSVAIRKAHRPLRGQASRRQPLQAGEATSWVPPENVDLI